MKNGSFLSQSVRVSGCLTNAGSWALLAEILVQLGRGGAPEPAFLMHFQINSPMLWLGRQLRRLLLVLSHGLESSHTQLRRQQSHRHFPEKPDLTEVRCLAWVTQQQG